MKALLYARFSSDEQSARSAADQLDALAGAAQRQGWRVAGAFRDEAVSGAVLRRPGLDALLAALDAGGADLVIAESLSRFSRDLADMAGLRRRIEGAGARLWTLAEGECSLIHVGLLGVMNEKYLADLAEMTRRGMRARAAEGRVQGGRRYGYRSAPQAPHGVEIDPAEAAIVREIYARYAAGETPRAIAADLNARGVKGPRGGLWRPNTISGDRKRQVGILENPIYAGELVFGRVRMKRDAASRKRVSVQRPEAEQLRRAAPALAIVDADTVARARAVKAARGGPAPWAKRAPARLFSGLIRCAVCGETYIVKKGETMRCRGEMDLGVCDNARRLDYRAVEAAALDAVREELLHPEAVAAFIDELRAALRDSAEGRAGERRRLARAHADAARAVARLLALVEAGAAEADLSAVAARIGEATSRRDAFAADLAALDAAAAVGTIGPPNDPAGLYRDVLDDIAAALGGLDGPARREATQNVRALVPLIEAAPGERNEAPVTLTIHAAAGVLTTKILGNMRVPMLVAGGRINHWPPLRITRLVA